MLLLLCALCTKDTSSPEFTIVVVLLLKQQEKKKKGRHTDDQHVQEKVFNMIREMQIKLQSDITSYLLEQLLLKRQEIASVSENLEKCEPWYTVGGNINQYSLYGKQDAGS